MRAFGTMSMIGFHKEDDLSDETNALDNRHLDTNVTEGTKVGEDVNS